MSHPDPGYSPENAREDDMDDNAQQYFDQQRREEETLQALANIAAAGMRKEADLLASECGLGSIWKAPLRLKREFEARQDGLPF